MFKKLLVFGASRGLGRAIARFSVHHFDSLKEITLVSRKREALDFLAKEIKLGHEGDGIRPFSGNLTQMVLDLTRAEDIDKAAHLASEDFDLVIYVAGGGPHGEYVKKDWKDHIWSLNLNLVSPLRLVHSWLKSRVANSPKGIFVVVGSRIAETMPDPLAVSYGAGKMGLLGFVQGLQTELEKTPNEVRLFSPGYMDTEMLPSSAKVRHDGSKLMTAETAAQALLRWLKKDGPWHRVLN